MYVRIVCIYNTNYHEIFGEFDKYNVLIMLRCSNLQLMNDGVKLFQSEIVCVIFTILHYLFTKSFF